MGAMQEGSEPLPPEVVMRRLFGSLESVNRGGRFTE
jgi:hypothetical protein